jgi:hypothetical protein
MLFKQVPCQYPQKSKDRLETIASPATRLTCSPLDSRRHAADRRTTGTCWGDAGRNYVAHHDALLRVAKQYGDRNVVMVPRSRHGAAGVTAKIGAGDLHKDVVKVKVNQMPNCCRIMKAAMVDGDEILPGGSPSGAER